MTLYTEAEGSPLKLYEKCGFQEEGGIIQYKLFPEENLT